MFGMKKLQALFDYYQELKLCLEIVSMIFLWRNSVDFGWIFRSIITQGFSLRILTKKQISKPEYKLRKKGTTPSNDRMVAELNMGFWVSFSEIGFSFELDELKENEIDWKYFIPRIMSGYEYPREKADKVRYWSKQSNIDNLILKLDFAKEIRNRIARYEPIFNHYPTYLSNLPREQQGNF